MRKGIGRALIVAGAVLALPASANATLLCVPNIMIPACHGTGASETTIQDAVNNGADGDTVAIAAGTYPETVTDTSKKLAFIGAGQGQTVIQAQGSPGMTVPAGASVSDLTIVLYNATGDTGLQLAGSATRVTVTATGANTQTNSIGVALTGGATFTHGSVVLPVLGTDISGYGGVVGAGTVSDSIIDAAIGAAPDGTQNQTPSVVRDRIIANQGIVVVAGAPVLDDPLVRTVAGAKPELGISVSSITPQAVAIRHATVIGSGSAASTGVSLEADGIIFPVSNSLLIDSSIIRGYATSISATAAAPIFNAAASVTAQRSFFDPATEHVVEQPSNPHTATAAITADAGSGNHDPLFVNPANGDFHLQAASPAIDAGSPSLGSGESTTDLDGTTRALTGHFGNAPRSDVGAFEFVPHPPTASAHASVTSAHTRTPIRFTATGTDPSPGDAVGFRWRFDDGATGSGAVVSHAFTRAGRHTATVTATDLDGFTASAVVAVTIIGPPGLSHVTIRPSRFRARNGTTIAYTDSQAARVTFVIKRASSKRREGSFTHRDRAGKNRVRFSGRLNRRLLAPGSYLLAITPRSTAGTGRTVTVRFTVLRPPRHRRGHPRR